MYFKHSPPRLAICRIYELYCDFVQKNPFHEVDQVIKSDLFDQNLFTAISAINKRLGASVT